MVASLILIDDVEGPSLSELLALLADRAPDSRLQLRSMEIVAELLGSSWSQAESARFNASAALHSLRLYEVTSIPRVAPGSIPSEISEVKFRVDLSGLAPLDLQQLRLEPTLRGAMVPGLSAVQLDEAFQQVRTRSHARRGRDYRTRLGRRTCTRRKNRSAMTNPEAERWSRTPLDPRAAFADALRHSMTEAEIENVMSKIGRVGAGASEAEGEDRAARAAEAAIMPLLADGSVKRASGIMVKIVGGNDLTEAEADVVGKTVHRAADPEAGILVGPHVYDSTLAGAVRVSVFAIGFDE